MNTHIGNRLVSFAAGIALTGCLGSAPTSMEPQPGSSGGGTAATGGGTTAGGTGTGASGQPQGPTEPAALAARQIDYGQALRSAALKLVGALPTLEEIAAVKDAASYAAQVERYLADPRFAVQIQSYFQDQLKMGGTIQVNVGGMNQPVSLDTAPTFAAELVVKDRAMSELFTATAGTCPTLDKATGAFTDADCPTANGLQTVGVLTNPGAMAQFYGNMAFRRVRWVQETFACSKFPAEFGGAPVQKGAGQYVSPWPFESITGGTDKMAAPIDFHDTSAVICANCHSTMNHLAPLFANFDLAGVFQSTVQVKTPVPMNPTTKLTDWLPAGQGFAWRYNKPVTSLTELGAAVAADPDVTSCHVARAWNWAMSKTDIVNDMAVVPASTINTLVSEFKAGGQKLKPTLRAIFTHDDFVKF